MLKNMFGLYFQIEFLSNIYNFSRAVWEDNLKKVQEHNLQADLGVHTYWLGMNEYADLVECYFIFFR